MPNNPLLRIGPFSRASSLSIKALRAYHEAGLLVPAEVDPQSGYRSYAAAQLTDAAVISRLRQLYLALEVPTLHTPVHIRHEPARSVLSVTGTVTEAEFESFLDRTSRTLDEAAAATDDVVVDGPFGGCYPTLLEDDAQEVVTFLPVVAPPVLSASWRAAGVRVGELPATDVAVLAHRGSYDTLDDSYRTLGTWVATNDEPADLPVRERYLVSPSDTDDPDELRTEICWPVLGSAEDT